MAGLTSRSLWRLTPVPWRKWRHIQVVNAADAIPERLPRKGVVAVGIVNCPTWLAFDCPCAERHRVMLNLDPSRKPYWSAQTISSLTISPSIDENRRKARCHYFVRKGRIEWVPYD